LKDKKELQLIPSPIGLNDLGVAKSRQKATKPDKNIFFAFGTGDSGENLGVRVEKTGL
jgi:hypothetical protein